MPPARDDETISNEANVLRALIGRWITMKGGRQRPTTDSMMDSNFENSCFVEGEISLEEMYALFPGRRIARFPAALLRTEGFWLERRPDEAPSECTQPSAHLVCGPPHMPNRGTYEAIARRIVKSYDVEVLPEVEAAD